MVTETVFDKVKKLDEQREKLLSDAKAEALAAAKSAVAELNKLGFSYELREASSSSASKASTRAKRKPIDGPCGICGFQTDPAHDGRKHRPQGENKKPFTQDELKALGMRKVG